MAIGYASMIATYNDQYFENWIDFISENFTLWENEYIILLNEEGDVVRGDLLLIEQTFRDKHEVLIKVRNAKGNAVTVMLSHIAFIVEYYSMDELLDDEDYNMLYDCLLARFVALSRKTQVGGFIFDRDGYTEDYVQFGEVL